MVMGHRVGRIKATTANALQTKPRTVIGKEKIPKLNGPRTLTGTSNLHSKTIPKNNNVSSYAISCRRVCNTR
jgi:hypothetical protein